MLHGLGNVLHAQHYLSAHELQDRNLMQSNYDRIGTWSGINMVVIVIVGVLQVPHPPPHGMPVTVPRSSPCGASSTRTTRPRRSATL